MKYLYKTIVMLLVISFVIVPLLAENHEGNKVKREHGSDCGGCPTKNVGMGQSVEIADIDDNCGPGCVVFHHLGGSGYYIRYADDLGISVEQIDKIEQVWIDHRKLVISKESELKIAQIELSHILNQTVPDYKRARGQVLKISSIDKEICLSHLESIEKAQNVLSKEQLQKLDEISRPIPGKLGKMM